MDAIDLVSQLLMERLPIFHEAGKKGSTEDMTGSAHLPSPSFPNHTTSSSTPSSPLTLTQRLTNQIGAEGMLAYLLDCYDRALHETRITAKVSQQVGQGNLSNLDTLGTEESVLISEVS